MAEDLMSNLADKEEDIVWEDVNVEPAQNDNAPTSAMIDKEEDIVWENVNIPNYTTLDADTGEVYSVPATMDETDTRFAIATQHENVGKENFIGKIRMPLFGGGNTQKLQEHFTDREPNKAKGFLGKEGAAAVQGSFKNATGYELKNVEQAPGAAAAGAYDIGTSTWQGQLDKWVDYYALSEYAETGKNVNYKAPTGSVPGAIAMPGEVKEAQQSAVGAISVANAMEDAAWSGRYTSEEIEAAKAEAKELSGRAVKLIDEWRNMNKERWEKTSNELYPMEMRDRKDIASLLYGIGNGGTSIGATIAFTAATKNPTIAGALIGKMFFDTEKSSAFQEARAVGEDFYAADWHSDVLGSIEGGLEGTGDWLTMGFGKFAETSGISKVMKQSYKTAIEKVLTKPDVAEPVKNAVKVVARKSPTLSAGIKSFLAEGPFEETLQNLTEDEYKNYLGWQDKDQGDILGDALWAGFVGGITGFAAGAGGSAMYNRKMSKWNNELKTVIKKENPNLSEADAQKAADLLQESYLQEGAPVIEELNNMLAKEKDVDALPDEGLNIKSIGEVTRNMMKERFGVTDEEIDNWVNVMLPMIDARNQYNEAYQGFYEQLTDAGRDEKLADREARIIAARATTLAIIRKQSVGDILNRWKLRIEGDQTKINMPGEDSAELDAVDVEPSTQEELNLLQQDINRLKRGVSAKKKAKGTRLAQFIVQNGGIADDRGDIKAMGSMPGLLNKKGISLDEAARMAWDAGYITGTERPDVNQLLDLLSDDLGNRPVYTENDQLKGDSNDYYRSLEDAIDRAGVDIENDSIEEIDRKLKVYRKRLAAWEQLGRDEEQNIAPDEDLPFWQGARKSIEETMFKPSAQDEKTYIDDLRTVEKGEETRIRVGALPQVYQSLGIPAGLVRTNKDVIIKDSITKHSVPLDVVENLPKLYADPIMVMDSRTVDGRIVALVDAKDKEGQQILVVISPNKRQKGGYHFIPSFYGKEELSDFVAKNIEEGNLKYIKSSQALDSLQLRPQVKTLLSSSITNVLQKDAIVKQNATESYYQVAAENEKFDAENPAYEGETITINGQEKTVYNSNGDRIAKSKEALENFYRWFGDSKVVDEQGRPLVVYHGTDAEFSVFDKSKQKGSSYYGKGFYFTNWSDVSTYGKIKMPLYLNIKNPLIIKEGDVSSLKAAEDVIGIHPDMPDEQKEWDFEGWAKYTLGYRSDIEGNIESVLSSKGYDGVIILDTENDGQRNKYIAFEPNQIKSTSNRGTYSEKENDIYWQSAVVRDLFDTQGDLFEQPQSKQTQTAQQSQQAKQLPAEAQKQVDDLFAYAEKQEGVKKEAPLFSDKKETQKIEKSYTASDNQKIVDVGDKLLGNLKRDTRVLSWEELEKMNDLLRAKNLTKANIYPKPSIEELRAQGLDGRPAAVVMYVYNSINAKPSKSVNPTIENQKRYYNVVKRTMDNTIEYAKTHKDEIENWQRSMSWNEDLLRMVFPSEEKTVGKIFRENREYNTEVAIAGGNKFANGMLISGYDLAELDKIAAGFEQEASAEKQSKASQTKEPWQRYFTVGKTYGGQYIVVDRNGKTISRDLTFDTVEKAVEFATKAYEIIKPHLRGEGETVDFSNMRNKGLQRRENNQNVNAQALIDTFGFRGINFGNWTKQSERQDFLNLTYDSLFDMAEILGIPAKAIGLEGKLGLAFGAQGHAGAVGHFIPAYNEINLTRKYGAGSLAHEWWHALDYYFGDQAKQKDYSGVPSLELKEGGALRSETFEAIKNLYDTISTTELTDEELKERAKKRYESLKYIVDHRADELKNKFAKEKNAEEIAKFIDELVAQDKNFDASKRQEYTEKFSEMIPERRRTWENAGIFTDMTYKLQSIHDLEDSQQSWRKSSEFYENARKLDKLENKSYWTKRTELGARAFASYIDDKIANRDWYNYFLSGHAKLQVFDDKSYLRDWADAQEKNTTVDVNDYRIPIYPANTVEQANINAAFDNLFNTIKVDESKDFKLYQSAYAPAQQDTARPQGARGSFTRRADTGEAIIELFETADASTIIHELGHFFLDDMKRFADDPTTAEQLQAIYKYVGSLDGNLSVEQHEYFARSFEAYIREGRSPNSTLKGVFDNFRTWLRNIYKTITGLNVDLDDNIRKVFDEMLGGRQLDFALQRGSQNLQTKLQRGFISAWNINKAMQLLHDGKMSKADMQELINELKAGKMEGKDFGEALKKFERNNNIHKERLTEWDYNYFRTQLDNLNFKRDQVKEKILRLLDWTKPRSRGGKLVGRFPNKYLNDAFDHFRELANMNKDEAMLKQQENLKLLEQYNREGGDIDAEQLIFDNKLLSLATGRISDDSLLELYEALSDSYNEGRLTDKITGEIKKARKERMINEAKEVLTDAGRINWHIEDRGLKAWAQKQLRNFGRSQMSWSGLLDMLSINDRSSKTGQSLLSQNLDMFEAEQTMYAGVAQDGENVSTRLEKALSGSANKAISVNRYINKELDKEVTIEWTGNENLGKVGLKPKPFMIRKTFTKDKLIDIYMKSKDKDTLDIMKQDKIHQYNDEFLAKVEAELTEDDIAVANALFDFYNDNYDRFNKFYEDHFGISLAHNKYYSPRSVTTTGINVRDDSPRAYASFSGAKQRTAGKRSTINIKGAFAALNQYVQDLNHYIGYADKLQDINAVMGNKDIKEIIANVFGGSMNARIQYEITNMANSGADKQKFWDKVTWLRSNYAKSVLSVKPSLAIKQLTSFPAYWENMSTVDFVSGVADFFKHPKEAMRILGNTTLMKTRGTNIIRDFEVMSKTETFKNMKKAAGKIKWNDLLMANIKFGDRGAIYIGGWALYKAELKKNLASGMSEADAKAAALNRFERVTDETQQSGRLSQQSYWQSNSGLRAFTMFTSSQNQYLRKELNAIRGLVSGRMDKKQVAKTIFIYHFLLPMFFQAVSDGFRWDKDAQLRTAVLGSLNGWFILNKILENIYNKVTGQASMFKANMTVRELVPFFGSLEDIYKDMEKLLDGDIEAEDVIKSIKTIGELTGLPLKYGTDVALNAGDYASEGEYGKEGLLWLGWSPYSLRDFNE